jgi:hypothetical protein
MLEVHKEETKKCRMSSLQLFQTFVHPAIRNETYVLIDTVRYPISGYDAFVAIREDGGFGWFSTDDLVEPGPMAKSVTFGE